MAYWHNAGILAAGFHVEPFIMEVSHKPWKLAMGHPLLWSKIQVGTQVDAPRTDRCSNRCALQILFIFLCGKNPETKATAAAFPQSFRPLRCFQWGLLLQFFNRQYNKNMRLSQKQDFKAWGTTEC
ncbi:hypothetical protein VK70_06115 [Paenibacillus durus ATCC 35681]|uniref:Uncharacterized protein n=1 Tax=Paenibacillus durus ATCC 35681 TaxID=1333534 RepID=A0A0F7F8U8_PAEDU|nr:hypothetical protein VK70_06115 [Paenibacillus durus ATCC 35681]